MRGAEYPRLEEGRMRATRCKANVRWRPSALLRVRVENGDAGCALVEKIRRKRKTGEEFPKPHAGFGLPVLTRSRLRAAGPNRIKVRMRATRCKKC